MNKWIFIVLCVTGCSLAPTDDGDPEGITPLEEWVVDENHDSGDYDVGTEDSSTPPTSTPPTNEGNSDPYSCVNCCDYSTVDVSDIFDYSTLDFNQYESLYNAGAVDFFAKVNRQERRDGCLNADDARERIRNTAKAYPEAAGTRLNIFINDHCKYIYKSGMVDFDATLVQDVLHVSGIDFGMSFVKYKQQRQFNNVIVDEYDFVDEFGGNNDFPDPDRDNDYDYGVTLCIMVSNNPPVE